MPIGQRAAAARLRGQVRLRAIPPPTRTGPSHAALHDGSTVGYWQIVLTKQLHETGLRAWHLHVTSIASVLLCIGLWIRAKTVDQEERGNAERRALFVGLWPPT